MVEKPLTYLPASQGFYDPPLGRYLPLLPRGVVGAWIKSSIPAGSLILDPLGANPFLPIEAAQAGARILLARNNPILWLLTEALARAPSAEQLNRILAKLLIIRRGQESIEDHLRSIYTTPCSGCGQMVQPLGFIWEKGHHLPVQRVYSCPQCGDEGERPISEYDIQNLMALGDLGLHRARALQRVLPENEYEQESIAAALDCYLPRALYVCMTLINHLDRLELDKSERLLLGAMFCTVFDEANSMWHWPARQQNIFQLNVPARFMEKNLWLALENSPRRLAQTGLSIPITYWPSLPAPQGGICLYQRRLAEKENLLQVQQPQAILTIFPRPNQAFWTLSALWSGWLWGFQAVAPMRSALARRRYDWRWFALALEAALRGLSKALAMDTVMYGLLSQAAPNHLMGLLTGAHASGFQLNGYAASHSDEIIQCLWRPGAENKNPQKISISKTIQTFLESRGEPCAFQSILNDCLAQLALHANLSEELKGLEESYFSQIQQQVSDVLHDVNLAQSFQISPTSSSQWWLADDRQACAPLSERMESALYDQLQQRSKLALPELESALCQALPGRLTPEKEALLVCLQSYADEDEGQPPIYSLRKGERPSARQNDKQELQHAIHQWAELFGFETQDQEGLIHWLDSQHQPKWIFKVTVNCQIAEFVFAQNSEDGIEKVLVFPGSHSRWLLYRLRQDARLQVLMSKNWHLLKFRYARWLATREALTLEQWQKLLDGDPPVWESSAQIQML